jgi:hypothetical protein
MVGLVPQLPKLPDMIAAIESEHASLPDVRRQHDALVAENERLAKINSELQKSVDGFAVRLASFKERSDEQERGLRAHLATLEADIVAKRDELQRVTAAFEAFRAEHRL